MNDERNVPIRPAGKLPAISQKDLDAAGLGKVSGQLPARVEYPRTDIGHPRQPFTVHCQHCNTYFHGSSLHHVQEWQNVHETGEDLAGRPVGFQRGPYCKELQRIEEARLKLAAIGKGLAESAATFVATAVAAFTLPVPPWVPLKRRQPPTRCVKCGSDLVYRLAESPKWNICRVCGEEWAVADANS